MTEEPVVPGACVLWCKRLSERAVLPTRGSAGAAGYDLYSAHTHACCVPAHGRAIVPTDIVVRLPPGTYGRVAPRSGLAVKHFIDTGAGVIDEDYRGPLGVVLFNHADVDFHVSPGDRIAQLIVERIARPEVREETDAAAAIFDDTERGEAGFGSTGTT